MNDNISAIVILIKNNIPKDEIIEKYSEEEWYAACEMACEYYEGGGCIKEGYVDDPRSPGSTVYGACDGCNGDISLGSNCNCGITMDNLFCD